MCSAAPHLSNGLAYRVGSFGQPFIRAPEPALARPRPSSDAHLIVPDTLFSCATDWLHYQQPREINHS
jgi:hypothetical protein